MTLSMLIRSERWMRKSLFCLIVLVTVFNFCFGVSLADQYEEIAEAQGGELDRFGPCVTEVVPESVRVVSVLPFEDETLVALWEAIAETDDNAFVFASAGLPGLDQYELFELFGTRVYGYDVAMGQLYVAFETDGKPNSFCNIFVPPCCALILYSYRIELI